METTIKSRVLETLRRCEGEQLAALIYALEIGDVAYTKVRAPRELFGQLGFSIPDEIPDSSMFFIMTYFVHEKRDQFRVRNYRVVAVDTYRPVPVVIAQGEGYFVGA